ncbi:hypothetical protein SAMN05444169_2219 [Bradyrhizobium erythrophlei]|uniref:Uncharacterized protein n=1 Tax=Bradyrhizobium erythrophlei TaxID=1437360 RepID=A0A1M5JGW3_9BRAD|nr:hypothetical protein SAMN05444169_2219 [Bradyrhizobium erythrophlei]
MIRNLLAIFAFASCLTVFASAAVATYFHFQAIANIPAGGPRRRIVKVNRLNALLFPDELSPIGLQYRVRCLRTLTAPLLHCRYGSDGVGACIDKNRTKTLRANTWRSPERNRFVHYRITRCSSLIPHTPQTVAPPCDTPRAGRAPRVRRRGRAAPIAIGRTPPAGHCAASADRSRHRSR